MKKKEEKLKTEDVERYSKKIKEVRNEISKVISGQESIAASLIRALISNGHVLVEGVPGTAKTLLIKVFGQVMGCSVGRVQFTVDLLPTDIIGLTVYKPSGGFEVIKGPVFANLLIADEVNRSPPKTQSALLEAMQEKQVTIAKNTYPLPNPFFVMATQNPIEQAGVYSLPEAQVDRFLFKIKMDYPQREEEKFILENNTDLRQLKSYDLHKLLSPQEILKIQELVKLVHVSPQIKDYIIKIVEATRKKDKSYGKYIEWGASPRASIGLFIASKAEAFMNGRKFVNPQDVKNVAYEVLRHRILLGYEAEAEKITSESIIKKILDETHVL